MMRTAGAGPDGVGLRALIVVLWRAGLRIGEALALAETDLDAAPPSGADDRAAVSRGERATPPGRGHIHAALAGPSIAESGRRRPAAGGHDD